MKRFTLFLAGLAVALGAAAATEDDATIRIGGDIDVTEKVDGALAVLGGRINVTAPVAGDASIAGGSITVKGPVVRDLHIAGGHVTIDGPVGGDASVAAGTLELGPDARIAGKLSFRGGELKRDPAAVVTGGIDQKITEPSRKHRHAYEIRPFHGYSHGWVWSVGLIVLAGLIAAALPGPSAKMAAELRERPWLTTLVGLVALTSIPVAAVLLMVTVIGIPIGLLALVLYAALLLVGYVWLAVVVGGLLLDRVRPEVAAETAWRAGAAVVAMLTLALLTRLPFVGGLVVFGALVVGTGMIVAAVMRKRMAPPASATVV